MNSNLIKDILYRCGIQANKRLSWSYILNKYKIDCIIDAGANVGQFYDKIRDTGFIGKIISFEPSSDNFKHLSWHDGYNWERFKLALSDCASTKTLNIGPNMECPSFHVSTVLPITNSEEVTTVRLDSFRYDLLKIYNNVLLKIDVEGHTHQVVNGASEMLDKCPLILAESNLSPRYESEPLLADDILFFNNYGYSPIHAEPVFSDENGLSVVFDILYIKNEN